MSDNDILNMILVAIAIIIIVHFIFGKNKIDTYQPVTFDIQQPYNKQYKSCHKKVKNNPLHIFRSKCNEDKYSLNTIEAVPSSSECSLSDQPLESPCQTIKQFNNDFFNFRNYTFKNSSMTIDPVDKINQLYLSGDLSITEKCKVEKIKDIYDKATHEFPDYQRTCVRTPDITNPESNLFSFESPIKGITSHDPEFRNQLDYKELF